MLFLSVDSLVDTGGSFPQLFHWLTEVDSSGTVLATIALIFSVFCDSKITDSVSSSARQKMRSVDWFL